MHNIDKVRRDFRGERDEPDVFRRSKRLERVKDGAVSRIKGGSESEIQDVKTELDTHILLGTKHEKKAKKELKRLGFLHG